MVTDERPGERMSDALRQRGISPEELAWVLGLSLEALELIQAAEVIPTTALRLEAALPLHGHELGPGITPLQAGLGWVVSWDKPTFQGKAALESER